MEKKTSALVFVGLCVVLAAAVVVLALVIWGRGSASREGNAAPAVTVDPAALEDAPVHDVIPAASTVAPADETASAETDAAPAATPNDDPEVPKRAQALTAAYFADAAFVGNDVVTALGLYDYDGLLTEADFFETETITDTGYLKDIKAADKAYGKIYIGLGADELAYKDSRVRENLETALDSLKRDYPGCILYIMSVTPMSQYKESISTAIIQPRALSYNSMLKEIAADKGAWYIDVFTPLGDEDGYIPSEVTMDGIHFTPGHYAAWYETLATHYIGDPA